LETAPNSLFGEILDFFNTFKIGSFRPQLDNIFRFGIFSPVDEDENVLKDPYRILNRMLSPFAGFD